MWGTDRVLIGGRCIRYAIELLRRGQAWAHAGHSAGLDCDDDLQTTTLFRGGSP